MMTACPQCDRLVDAEKPRCLYCGAILAQRGNPRSAPPPVSAPAEPNPDCRFHSSPAPCRGRPNVLSVDLCDLPPALRNRIDDTNGGATPRDPVQTPCKMHKRDLSPASILKMLTQIKESFDNDRLDYDEYRSLAVDALLQHIAGLNVRDRMNFVFQELKESDLASLIDEPIFNALSAKVLAAATKTANESAEPHKKKRKLFRLFRR